MNDDSIVAIMQSLGLDYNPAINSTVQFQKTIGDLNKQLETMKTIAMESAKDINNAFSSQLGKMDGNKDLANSFKNAKQEAQVTSTTVSKMAKEIKESSLVNMQAQASYVQQRVSAKGLSDEYGKQASTLREQLSAIQSRLQSEGKLTAEETEQTNQLKEQLDILRAQTRAAGHDENRLNPSTPTNEFENKSSWFTDATKFYAITKAAKEATVTIKDVEMGMIEISRVMDDTSFVFNEYRDNLFKLGTEYGQTFDNVQSVALRWAQSGYNVADSLTLTETSMLALNTAELDATNATESMIGIMAQWGLQAEDLALVMDKVNKTADNYSLTSQDLVDGLLRSSGAAKVMGMSLDDTIATLTVLRETTGRTGKEVGNALSSILSYIQRPKSIDVMESLGIKMFADEAKTEFRNVMEVFDELSNKWNDPSVSSGAKDALMAGAQEAGLFAEELAGAVGMQEEFIEMTEKATEAQGEFTDIEKRDAAQAAAGVYRRNYFIGLLEKFSTTQEVLNGLVDAGGYSLSENAKTMETLEKKQQSLKASVEALSVAMGDAGLDGALKMIVNSGTNTIEVINKLPKPIKDAVLAATSMTLAVKALEYGMNMFGIQVPGISQMIGSLTSGTWSLTAAFKAGASGLGAFVVANGPLLALSAAVGVIMAITNAAKKQREEREKLIETTKDNIKSLEDEKQGLQELSKEYDTLKTKEKNLTATADEKIRLRDIQRELVDLYGVSITGIDAEGKAYSDSAEAIRDKIKAMEEEKAFEEAKLENAVKASDVQDLKDLQKNLDERKKIVQDILVAQAEMDRLEGALARKEKVLVSDVMGSMEVDPTTDQGHGVLLNFINQQAKTLTELETSNGKINDAINEGTGDRQRYLQASASKIAQQLSEDGATVSDSMRLYADGMARSLSQAPRDIYTLSDELQDAIDDFTSSDFTKWEEKYKKAVSESDTKGIDEASKAILGLTKDFVGSKKELGEYTVGLDEFAMGMERSFGDSNALKDATSALNDGLGEGVNKLSEYAKAIEGVGKEFEDSSDNLDTYYRLLEEVNSKEGLSAQTKRNIISSHKELIPYIHDEQELRRQLISIIEDEEETQRKAYASMLAESESFYDTRIKGNSDLVNSLNEYYNTDFNNFTSLAQAKGKVEVELVSKLSGIWAQYYNAVKIGMGNTDAMLEDMVMKKRPGWEKANEVLGVVHKVGDMENAFNNIALDLGGTDFKSSGSKDKKGSGKGSSKEKKEENKALQESLKLLEHRKRISEETQGSIRNELAELQRISSLYVKTDQERMDMAERIYAVEKRLRDRRLQDSLSWISEKKNFNEMSTEDEIAAWTRVRDSQTNNIQAVKQATLELYKLKNQVMIDAYNREESTIQHLTKLSVLSTEQQIVQYKKLYEVKAKDLSEQQKRTENLFALQKQLMSEQQKKAKEVYDERINQIESETKARKDAQEDIIKGIEKELELLDRQEGEYNHDKKMSDLREQLAYWEVRTSEDARKKVIDLKKQIDEAEHKREVDLKKQGLEDKKKVLQDQVTAIDDTAKEERENLDKSYKLIENAFDDHSLNVVAMAEVMSKGAYDEWLNNYIIPLQNALADGDFGTADSIFGDLGGFIDSQKDNVNGYDGNLNSNKTVGQSNSSNAQVYSLANQILELKRQYEIGKDKSAAQRAVSTYDELSKLKSSVSDNLHRMDYQTAQEYVKGLPKMHKGGKSLSYGAVEMMPGELTFPPDLSVGLERLFPLLSNLAKGNVATESTSSTDNRKSIKIENLLRIDNNHMQDDVDERSLSRELERQLANML
ncbi:MAG TPA: phage tail tape measure protein [Epulopiscium sp.]|nr:phage tail tape measure protein [Candidatus Epulonipiscium sp.]